jgi:hypothetical protein
VGGERGFDAAVAFRDCAAAVSEVEGESMNTTITIHNSTPTITVSGFVRRKDRTGPMAAVYCWVSSIQDFSEILKLCVSSFGSVEIGVYWPSFQLLASTDCSQFPSHREVNRCRVRIWVVLLLIKES